MNRSCFSSRSLAFVCLILATLLLASASPVFATDPAHKIWAAIDDGTPQIYDITNTGTINALNRVFESGRMSLSVKTNAMTEILTGAVASGNLVSSTLVPADLVFVLDGSVSEIAVATYTTSSFTLPTGSTDFSRLYIPGGLH